MRPPALAATVLTSVALLVGGCAATANSAAVPPFPECTLETLEVTLSPDAPTPYYVAGQLCRPAGNPPRARTVLLLVSGLTYDRHYWDLAYHPDSYSFVYAAIRQGYTTFNIDRLGVGVSDHPAVAELTLPAQAYTVSQVVAKLRTGNVAGTSYQTVVGVGHSVGSAILRYEAGTVADQNRVPDYLVLTGYLHEADPTAAERIAATVHPAADDPLFAQLPPAASLPAGYLTTQPGARGWVFHHGGSVDPEVAELDDRTRQTATAEELTYLTTAPATAPEAVAGRGIAVPTLVMVGEHDSIYCNDAAGLSCATPSDVLAREAPQYEDAACLAAAVVPGAGHAINMHRAAPDGYNQINDWLNRYTAAADRTDAGGCLP